MYKENADCQQKSNHSSARFIFTRAMLIHLHWSNVDSSSPEQSKVDSSSPEQCCNDAPFPPPPPPTPVPNTNRTQMACSSARVSSLQPSHPPCTPTSPSGGPVSPCTPYIPQRGSSFTLHPAPPTSLNGGPISPCTPTSLNGGPV